MRVKRFVSETLQDAMQKLKTDMGKDAIILHTRKYKEGGFFGLFGKQMFEVTGAVENTPVKSPVRMPVQSQQSGTNDGEEPNKQQIKETHEKPGKEQPLDSISELYEEMQEMKQLLNEMKLHIEAADDIKTYPKILQKYYQILAANEVDEKIVRKIIKEVSLQCPKEKLSDTEYVEEAVVQQVFKLLKKPKPIAFKRQGLNQQSIALVGPTGVGKTTTIAKLAATFSIVDKKKVALITADTYRVAAVEQLKTYGEIIGIPVDVVFSPMELQEAISSHADKDLILIDTAGRSHKNAEQMDELKNYLNVADPTDIFLVLSATTRNHDLLEIVDHYDDIPINRVIFTKLDETNSIGTLLNLVHRTQKSLSYVTVGQNVPDDIEVVDTMKIAKMLTRER